MLDQRGPESLVPAVSTSRGRCEDEREVMVWSCFLSCDEVSTLFSFLQRWDGQKLLAHTRAISKSEAWGYFLRSTEGSCVEEEVSPWLPDKQGLVATKWSDLGHIWGVGGTDDFQKEALEKGLC